MTLSHWILFGFLAAAAFSAAFFVYARREPPGRGRRVLAVLRGLVLALLLLLLFDPGLPAHVGGGGGRVVLLDASLSMQAPARAGETRWDAAVRQARAAGGRILLFGDRVRAVPTDSLATTVPVDAHSRLAPALRAVAETGATEVRVLTDGALEDEAEALAVARTAGISVTLDTVPAAASPDLGIAELDVPSWAEADRPLHVRLGVTRLGTGRAEPFTVEVRAPGGQVLGTATAPAPAAGRVATIDLDVRPEAPEGGGLVRLQAVLTQGDAFAGDDLREFYVYVADAPTGVAVVSFVPGQEPRFLVPVLQDALGLPVRGFLRVAAGRYTATGTALTGASPADEDDVRSAVEHADLVVFHGFGADAPEWARRMAPGLRRFLVFPEHEPAGPLGSPPLPIAVPAATDGDWYVTPEPPPSPLGAYLSGLALDSLPPLLDLRTLRQDHLGWAPLLARLARTGEAAPALVAGQSGERRWAVALGSGYWRWAFRGGAPREAYRTLWSALAGWLMRQESGLSLRDVRPKDWVSARGEPLRWVTPGLAADSIGVQVRDSTDTVVLDTVAAVGADGSAVTRTLPPGDYRYAAAAFARDSALARAEGPLTVERYSPDYLRPAVAWGGGGAGARPGGTRPAGVRRPLHASAWPYVLLVGLLCAEWALRRRWGLR